MGNFVGKVVSLQKIPASYCVTSPIQESPSISHTLENFGLTGKNKPVMKTNLCITQGSYAGEYLCQCHVLQIEL